MTNPHYRRLTMTYRRYFERMQLPLGWLVWLVVAILIYWQESYQIFWLLPIIIFGVVLILGIETARFVGTDHHQPIYEMTLLTPLSASDIVGGYRQAAFARTARWLGLNNRLFTILVIATYLVLSYKMELLVEEHIQREFQANGTANPFFGTDFVRNLIIMIFTAWASLLFSTLTYYLLVIEVNIELALRLKNWGMAFVAGLITVVMVFASSIFVAIIAAYIIGLFAYLNEAIPIILTMFIFCVYPLYWRNVFRERALNNIRSVEKQSWDKGYVDLA